jgi:hypothetical protein
LFKIRHDAIEDQKLKTKVICQVLGVLFAKWPKEYVGLRALRLANRAIKECYDSRFEHDSEGLGSESNFHSVLFFKPHITRKVLLSTKLGTSAYQIRDVDFRNFKMPQPQIEDDEVPTVDAQGMEDVVKHAIGLFSSEMEKLLPVNDPAFEGSEIAHLFREMAQNHSHGGDINNDPVKTIVSQGLISAARLLDPKRANKHRPTEGNDDSNGNNQQSSQRYDARDGSHILKTVRHIVVSANDKGRQNYVRQFDFILKAVMTSIKSMRGKSDCEPVQLTIEKTSLNRNQFRRLMATVRDHDLYLVGHLHIDGNIKDWYNEANCKNNGHDGVTNQSINEKVIIPPAVNRITLHDNLNREYEYHERFKLLSNSQLELLEIRGCQPKSWNFNDLILLCRNVSVGELVLRNVFLNPPTSQLPGRVSFDTIKFLGTSNFVPSEFSDEKQHQFLLSLNVSELHLSPYSKDVPKRIRFQGLTTIKLHNWKNSGLGYIVSSREISGSLTSLEINDLSIFVSNTWVWEAIGSMRQLTNLKVVFNSSRPSAKYRTQETVCGLMESIADTVITQRNDNDLQLSFTYPFREKLEIKRQRISEPSEPGPSESVSETKPSETKPSESERFESN